MADQIGEPDQQADVVAFLETASALQPGETARRIDTHAARVFLAGDRAWKLKRAVHFGYLDFSSIEKRRAALETELILNRRTAPTLYLAVRPICRDGRGALNLEGRGGPVDWLLEMKRFPDGALLEDVAARGELTDAMIMQLADQVCAFHADAGQVRLPPGHDRIEAVIAGNRASMAAFPDILPAASVNGVIERQIGEVVHHAALLDARAAQGRVRHAHGDLHLANIAAIDGQAVMFDCLEFSPSLATVDVLYDLAFLLMDLWARGFEAQANMLLNRYLDVSPPDEAGIALIPLFLSIRATIRAHALAAQAGASPESELARKAQHYLAIADGLLAPIPPQLVAIGGLSGTGKSTIARLIGHHLGRAPGARILRSDVLRKRLAGVLPETALPRDAYTPANSAAVYDELERLANQTLQAGQAVIADAVYAKLEERNSVGRLARQRGVKFDGIWLEAPLDLVKERLDARVHDASDADTAVAEIQASYDLEVIAWHRVSTKGSRKSVAKQVREILDNGEPSGRL